MRKHIDPSETILMLSILLSAASTRWTVYVWRKRQTIHKQGSYGPTSLERG